MSMFLSRVAIVLLNNGTKRYFSRSKFAGVILSKNPCLSAKQCSFSTSSHLKVRDYTTDSVQPTVALENGSILLKKKTIHKKPILEDLTIKEGHYLTLAYATANSYDLKSLKDALQQQKLYEPGNFKAQEIGDVVVASAVYAVGTEPREIIFFREGAVVFWNCSELEAHNVLEFISKYEIESYPRDVVEKEREIMTYAYQTNAKRCNMSEETFQLVRGRDNSLERYTFSHAMAQSARLGAWEARLAALAAAVRAHAALLERDGVAAVDKKQVVRRLGELFSLRHRLNVESDLLDIPDFYWEEEQLEKLYSSTVAYFTIPRRIRVLNERLSHCVELLELLSSWAADRHHVRLEWMVIALILAEVCFEMLHLLERHLMRPDRPHTSAGAAVDRRRIFSTDLEENMFQDLSILDT